MPRFFLPKTTIMRILIFFCFGMITFSCLAQNVGIGIITPTAKLHSMSSINAPAGRFEATSTSFSPYNFGYGVLTGKYTGAAVNSDIVGVYGQSE
jgi:hypothetical protein